MASVGSWIVGSGTSSMRTSRLPCQVRAFMSDSLPDRRTQKPRRRDGAREGVALLTPGSHTHGSFEKQFDETLPLPCRCGRTTPGALLFNLATILRESATKDPGKPVALLEGNPMSYGELDRASDQLATGLQALGVNPGDAVGIQLPNIPQFLISYFGLLKAGAVAVPMNVLLKAPEVAFYLGDSGAKALVTFASFLQDARGGAEQAGV